MKRAISYIESEAAGDVKRGVERPLLAVVDEGVVVAEEDEHARHRLQLVLTDRLEENLTKKRYIFYSLTTYHYFKV